MTIGLFCLFSIFPDRHNGVKFVGTDIQVDNNGFIIAESSNARQFVPKHYLDPIPLQQIQLSNGTLEQNPGW